MTPRRVAVALELELDVPLRDLGSVAWWQVALDQYGRSSAVLQAQANVIRSRARKPARAAARKKRR